MSFSRSRTISRGFSLVEVVVVIAIIGLLFGLVLPAVQSARASSRKVGTFTSFMEFTQIMPCLG